jgi:competence protein ComEC
MAVSFTLNRVTGRGRIDYNEAPGGSGMQPRWLLASLIPALLSVFAPAFATGNRFVVSCLDVGQGDSMLLQMPTGENVLIDAGVPAEGKRVLGYLRDRHVANLDMVIMTHPHSDHIGGLPEVLKNIPVRLVLDSGMPYPSRTYHTILGLIDEKGIALKLGRPGMQKDYGPVHMDILAPIMPLFKEGKRQSHGHHAESAANNNSIVTRWRYGNFSLLATGDAEQSALDRLMNAGANLQATILKVAHHGSRYTSGLAFLKRVHPEVALISAGLHNDYGHPHLETLERLKQVGARSYLTAQVGTITVTSDGKTYQVTTGGPSQDPARGSHASSDANASPKPAHHRKSRHHRRSRSNQQIIEFNSDSTSTEQEAP